MGTVGVRELKNRLTYYLRRTKQGEEFVVTDRGRPIALLQPMRSPRHVESLEARLAQLAAQGRVALPNRKPLSRLRPVKLAGKPMSQIILKDRQ